MNRKGDVTDVPLFLIMIFFLAMSFITVIFVNDIIKTEVIDNPKMESSATDAISSAIGTVNTVTTQRGFALMMAILIIGIIASSFLVRVHPAFIFLYIFIMGVSIFVSVFLANTYEKLINVDIIAPIAAQQPMITFFMQHLVGIILGVSALSMIIIFAKLPQFGGGTGAGDIV